jgi:predicted dehydrogenase
MRALVLGCGSIGGRHAVNLKALGIDVVIADTDVAAAARLAASTGASVVTRESAPPCELVVVATPTAQHVADLGWALDRDADVFVEKPLTWSRTEATTARELVRDHADRVVMVGCNLRFSEGYRALSESLTSVGKPVAFLVDYGWWLPAWRPEVDYRSQYSARRSLGGGIVLDAIHEIDYTLALAGPAVEVSGRCSSSGTLEIDVEDVADITLRHGNGAQSHIHMDYLRRRYSRSCTVIGNRAQITWDVPTASVQLVDEPGADPRPVALNVDSDPNRQYVEEMKHMLAAMGSRTPTSNDVGRAATTLDVAITVLEEASL